MYGHYESRRRGGENNDLTIKSSRTWCARFVLSYRVYHVVRQHGRCWVQMLLLLLTGEHSLGRT